MNAKPSPLDRLLAEHRRIALDSNALIYLIDERGPRGDVVAAIIDACATRTVEGVLSTVAITEVLTGPARSRDGAAFERMTDTLRELPLRWVPPSVDIAEDAAWIRGSGRVEIADALHVATARAAGATVFVTNDRDIPALPQLEVVYLDDLVA